MTTTYNDMERPEATGKEDHSPDSLTPQQHQAVLALLEYPTVKESASSVGIHKATLYKWLGQPGFGRAYREARRQAFSSAVARLQAAASGAVATLLEIAEDPSQQGAARVGAARTILDFAVKAVAVEDLATDMEELKAGLGGTE